MAEPTQWTPEGTTGWAGGRGARPARSGSVVGLAVLLALGCGSGGSAGDGPLFPDPPEPDPPDTVHYAPDAFVMGADLSYVNQVLDHGGTYRDSVGVRSPYAIFADHGANTVRLRLWHDPSWVRTEVYGSDAVPLYSGLEDVARAIAESKAQGLEVALDIHYSDVWADPSRQDVPAAWRGITELEVLADSVYGYTRAVLERLAADDLLPELVQVGNEINCGMLSTGAGPEFPQVNVCEGDWAAQGVVLNAGIRAVREAAPAAEVILHVAQPENVSWWLEGITGAGGVSDFDVIGLSYYPAWSDEPLASLSDQVAGWRSQYGRAVMVVETAYPWTLRNNDSYGNIFGENALVPGYEATPEGQRDYMIDLVQEVMDGGGSGVFYWEPAWITSELKDLWGTGSSWENNALFDFSGRAHRGFEFYTYPYDLGGEE